MQVQKLEEDSEEATLQLLTLLECHEGKLKRRAEVSVIQLQPIR